MNKEDLMKYWSYCELVNTKNFDKLPSSNKLVVGYDEGGIFDTGDEIIIVIDGSNDVDEWISNFRFKANERGFHSDLYNVAFEFFIKLRNYTFDKPVKFVGHSRGGLVLILAHLLNIKNSEVITFCSPKVCSIFGYRRLSQSKIKHTRVTITRDIVDNLPPIVFGFVHYSTQKFKLDSVVGKLNHIAIREAIEQMR
jgi:hypothetical protein